MPHYADGTECKVGDQVVGKLANSGNAPKAGVVISVTPGVESCNAMVRFTEVTSPGAAPDAMPLAVPMAKGRPELGYSANHCSSGYVVALHTCEDYADTGNLSLVSRGSR